MLTSTGKGMDERDAALVREPCDITEIQKVEIFGLPVHRVTMQQAVALSRRAIETRSQLVFGMLNCAKVVALRRDTSLRQAVLAADVIAADGMFVVWAGRLLRRPLPERIDGIGLFVMLLELADQEGLSVYFLGAKEDVLKRMLRRISSRYPDIRVAGYRDGYFGDDQREEVAETIRRSKADMLFIGMSSPRKEDFLARWSRFVEVPVCHGVGGSFDVLAGKVKRAPGFFQKAGLEWLYRVFQEPRRLGRRYLVTNTVGIGLLVREIFRERLGRGRGRSQPAGSTHET